ncbi:MAG TPA: response regulator [Blastocatellia bacterium]|nr:response regulator [Blastocatellia bacterium]
MDEEPQHILCVEDDWDVCEACRTLETLRPELKFTFAHDFDFGLKLIRLGTFDLYLLSSKLPVGSGIDLCREVRKTDGNTPVAILVNAADPWDTAAVMEAGASAFLDKPAALFQMESTVIALLRQAETRSLDARIAEIATLRDSIHDRLSILGARITANTERLIYANELMLKAHGFSTFVHSGGTRANFERLWPGVVGELATEADPRFDLGALQNPGEEPDGFPER